jgi:RHS repeat-associated protein
MTQTGFQARAILSRYVCGIAFLFALTATSVYAQNSPTNGTTPTGLAPGAPTGSYSLSGFENVNLFNGNLNFSLPLLKVGGRGSAQTGINLTLDSIHWTVEHEPGSGEPETYDPYHPGTHPPIIGGGGTGTPPAFDVTPDWWEGLRPGYGPGVLQGRVARQGRSGPTLTRLTFTAPDGTEYELRDTYTGGKPLIGTNRYRGTIFVSANGASMTFVSNTAITDVYTATGFISPVSGYLMMADGTRYDITNGLVMKIRDRNGNQLTFTYYGDQYDPRSQRVHTIADSLGRVVTITYFDLPGSTVAYDKISFSGFGGAERTIKIWRGSLSSALRNTRPGDSTTTQSIGALFADVYADGMGGSSGSATYNPTDLTTSVELPDGRRYWLYYNVYGELARVVLPTGGAIEYDYTPGAGVLPDTSGYQIHRCVLERRVYSDGNTLEQKQTYSPVYTPTYNGNVIESWKTEVMVEQHDLLRAAGSTLVSSSKHTFYGSPVPSMFQSAVAYPEWKEGREKQVETFDANGNSLRLSVNTWEQCTECEVSVDWWTNPAQTGHTSENAPPNNPHLTEAVTTLKDITPNLMSKQKSVYDKYNNVTRIEDYGYAESSVTCPLLRRTETGYVTSTAYTDLPLHLRNLAAQVSIYDASGIERARTAYEYDNYIPDTSNRHAALVTYYPNAITGRDAAFTSEKRGNVTSTAYWLLAADGSAIRAISNYQQFDINGNRIKFIDPRGNATTYDFTDNFGAPGDNEARTPTAISQLGSQKTYASITKATDMLGHAAYTQFDYWSGVMVNSEDVNSLITSAFYDDTLNRPTRLVLAAGTSYKNQFTVTYDDANHLITSTSDLNAYNDNLLKLQVIYDGLGRTVETRSYENSTAYITAKQEYDGLGRVKRSSSPYRTTSDATYGWTETAYDALGRVVSLTTPDGLQLSTVYSGNRLTGRDQAGKQRRRTLDAQGRLTSVDEMSAYPSTSVYATTTYSYDVMDNLVGVVQGVQTRSFGYDSLKRLISSTNPESGAASYSYDDNNNLLEKVDPRLLADQVTRVKTSNAYDALNRLTSRTYNDGTPAVNFYYDNQTLPTGAPALERGASVGKVLAVTYGGAVAGTYFGYDSLGRLMQSAQVTDGQKYEMSYGYNLTGIMTRETYPSGRTLTTSYDAVGRLSSLGGQHSGEAYKQYLSQLSYAPDGSLKAMQLGNGLWQHVSVNKRWQATEIGVGTSSTDSSLLKLNYDYGTNNNGTMRSQVITVPGLSPLTQTYTYDQVNRLTVAEENGGASWRQTFAYDQYGNRSFVASQTTSSLLGANPSFNPANNRIAAGQGYGYDAAGNLVSDAQGHSYAYDAENRQTNYNAGIATYVYDGSGQRVKKVVGAVTTIFVYDVLGRTVAEYNNSNLSSSNGTTYTTTDALGSPRLLTNAQAAVVSRHDYAPFGEELSSQLGGRSSQSQQYMVDDLRKKFTGQERDSESSLDYFYARYYGSAQGRFTSADPLLSSGKGANPQTWNRYSYTLNDPLNLSDPSGMSPSGAGQGVEAWSDGVDKGNQHPHDTTQQNPSLPPPLTPEQRAAMAGDPEGPLQGVTPPGGGSSSGQVFDPDELGPPPALPGTAGPPAPSFVTVTPGATQTLNGSAATDCNGRTVNDSQGNPYNLTGTFVPLTDTVIDQYGQPFYSPGLTVTENVEVIDQSGGTATDVSTTVQVGSNGTFCDAQFYGTNNPQQTPAKTAGDYLIQRQTLSTTTAQGVTTQQAVYCITKLPNSISIRNVTSNPGVCQPWKP